jgi:hypothetical protein
MLISLSLNFIKALSCKASASFNAALATNPSKNLQKTQIDTLPNPTQLTMHKLNYLFDVHSDISLVNNIITFSIDFNSTSNCAIVDFKYPLYDELCTLNNNTLFGLYLEDFEILLFKKIYEEYIINMINNLFHKDIEVPKTATYILNTILF